MGGFVDDFMGLLDLLEAGLSALSPYFKISKPYII